jgi:hypothetical protein
MKPNQSKICRDWDLLLLEVTSGVVQILRLPYPYYLVDQIHLKNSGNDKSSNKNVPKGSYPDLMWLCGIPFPFLNSAEP